MLPTLWTAWAAAAAMAAVGGRAAAQPAAAPDQPASAMGLSVTGLGGDRSALTFTYPADPGAEAAAADARALATAGGWRVDPPKRAVEGAAVFYESQISPAVTLDARGDPPLFPFLKAFQRYPEIALVFVGAATAGPSSGSGQNRYVTAQWTRSGGVISYRVRLRDASFTRAEDIASLEAAPAATQPPAPRRSLAAVWALLLLASAGAGVFVWGLTWWLLSLREPSEAVSKEETTPVVANTPEPEEGAAARAAE